MNALSRLLAAPRDRTVWQNLEGLLSAQSRIGPKERWLSVFMFTAAALLLGFAIQISDGTFHPTALFFLTLALLASVIGVYGTKTQTNEEPTRRYTIYLLGLGLVFQILQMAISLPAAYLELGSAADLLPFRLGMALVAILSPLLIVPVPRLSKAAFPSIIFVFILLGVWVIRMAPAPYIDVFYFHVGAIEALLRGENPYSLLSPDIYRGRSSYYGPGLSVDGRLPFGFIYPPLSLLLAVPGHLLGGDFRYSQLGAMALSGLFIAYARPSRISALAATLLLFTPRSFFVLGQAWTEPFVVMLVCAVVFCACRAPRFLWVVLGLLLAVKQHLVLAVPAALLLVPGLRQPRAVIWFLSKAGLVALLVTVPLMLWDVAGFIRGVVAFQFQQPFRQDALSYLVLLVPPGNPTPPLWIAFVVAAAAAVLALWRLPRTPAGFAAGTALIFFAFFAFNKQAFCNYYYFVIGALWCAVGAMQPAAAPGDSPSEDEALDRLQPLHSRS